MSNFRRWYFYVVSAVSLQAVTWAVIALLRNLLTPLLQPADPNIDPQLELIAFQISVIIIGLPMFLLHWRWAQRPDTAAASEDPDHAERTLYLYFMIGAFLIPLLANANGFLQSLLRLVGGMPAIRPFFSDSLPDPANLVYTGSAVFILALMLLYHARLLQQERLAQRPSQLTAALHRLFIYLFSAVGLAMTSFAAAGLLRWLLLAAGDRAELSISTQIINNIAAIVVALPLWLYFWRHAQALFRDGGRTERASILRKVYLYLVIFLAVLATVSALTALLAGLFRRLLDLDPQAGSGTVLSALIVGGVVWAYHTLVLREDTRLMPVQAEQAGVRRLYWYLVAGVGLLALLIGLGGLLGVLFDPADYVISRQREQLAWFTATLLAGLIVWIVPWRKIQRETAEPPPAGASARTSIVRRFYLFFFLLFATLTFLITAIYVLSRLLLALLGEPLSAEDLRTMGLALAYALMAAAVWLYHGRLLQQDRQMLDAQQERRAAAMRIVVVDDGDGSLGCRLLESLKLALPGSTLVPVGLTSKAAAAMNAPKEMQNVDQPVATADTIAGADIIATADIIAGADIIVGPWSMALSRPDATFNEELQAAITSSPARKLILPRPAPGWLLITGERWRSEPAVREATEIIESIIAGEAAAARTPSGPAMVIFLIAATILILILVAALLGTVIPLF